MTLGDTSPSTALWFGVLAVLVYKLWKRYVQSLKSDVGILNKPAGGHWLWGHEADLFKTTDRICSDFADKLGGVFPIKGALFYPDILVITDPGAIGHIFSKHPYGYTKGSNLRALMARVMGKGLNWADGSEHKRQRSLLSPCFTPAKVQQMENDILHAAEKLTTSLHTYILENNTNNGCCVNLVTWTCRATLDVIGAVGFSHDFQSGSSPEAQDIFRVWNQMVSAGLSFGGFVGPLVLRALPFIGKLPLPAVKRQMAIRNITQRIGKDIVEERTLQQASQAGHEDILGILMRTGTKERGIDQILDNISAFFLLGHESTVTVINFALYELAKHKPVQIRVRQEILDFVGSRKGGEPTYEEYQLKLPLLDAVFKEVLRLYPSAPRLMRVALDDDILPLRKPILSKHGKSLNFIRIAKGQYMIVPIISNNRLKSVWGPNADEFNPDRWLSPETLPPLAALTQGWSGISTFSEGPRMCIGHRLANFEFKIILSTLLKNFEFFDTGIDISTRWSLTLQPFIVGREEEGVQLPIGIRPIA